MFKVEPFLYNKGAGRYIPISKIVLIRNIDRARHKQLPEIRCLENPDEEFDIEQHLPVVSEIEYQTNPSGYREVCWDLKVRDLYRSEFELNSQSVGTRCCWRVHSSLVFA